MWDFVYARRLLSNGTYRPIHDAALGFEHCMVAKARQRLPKRFAERLRALEALRHPDGTPVYRVEETKPLLGSRAPRMEAERPKQRRWNRPYKPLPGGHRSTRAAPSCSSRTRPTSSTPRGTGWSAPRARATGTPGRRWRRSCASA